MLPEYLEVGVEAGRGCIILPILLCLMNCPLKWRLGGYLSISRSEVISACPLDCLLKWRLEDVYLEVNIETGRACIRLPILLCPLDCPLKWRLEDER
jgi:hypothetical protein